MLVKWACFFFFFQRVLSASLGSVTLVKQNLQSVSYQTMRCPEWKWGELFLAKQMAETNVIQLPVETNVQKVKSIKTKKDRVDLSISEHHSMEENK